MSKHTPGPWALEEHPSCFGNFYQLLGPNGDIVDHRPTTEVGRANAKLMTASPDLLAVCQEILEHGTDDLEARMVTLRKAVTKATT